MNEPQTLQNQVPERFPRVMLLAIGSVMVLSFALAAVSRIQSGGAAGTDALSQQEAAQNAVVASRSLRFEDRPDGSIAVIDVADGPEIDTVKPGADNFLRRKYRPDGSLATEEVVVKYKTVSTVEFTVADDKRITLDAARLVDSEYTAPPTVVPYTPPSGP